LKERLTRREFIALSAMVATSAALSTSSLSCIEALQIRKGVNPEDFAIVIVGAGLGGLTCGAYLAKSGFPVTILEQHTIPGGYATCFQRGGYRFDVSLHSLFIRPDIFKELSLSERIECVQLNQGRRLITPEKDLLLPDRDPEAYVELMCKNYSKETEGIKRYFNQCFGIFDELIKLNKKMEEGYFFKLLFPFQFPKMWTIRNKTVSDLLDEHVKDINTRHSLCHLCEAFGLPPSKLSGFIYAMATAGFSRAGSMYIKNQSQALSNALTDIIEENGGIIILGSLVEQILMKNGRVAGVITSDGQAYPSKIVISNASAPDTFGKFLRTNPIAQEYLIKLSRFQPSISSFIVWLGLKRELRGKIPGCIISLASEMDTEANFKHYLNCDAEKANISIALYDNYYTGYSRPGTSTMTILMLSGYEPWRRFEKDYVSGNKKEYYREKYRIARILIRRVEEKLIPGLSSLIDVMESATPLTNVAFTKNPEGAIYGYPNHIDNSFMTRFPSNATPVKGLYHAGGWSKYAGSYPEAMMGGRNVFKLIVKEVYQ